MNAEEFLEHWQNNFQVLEPKWHKTFLNDLYLKEILTFDDEEILSFFSIKPTKIEYSSVFADQGKKVHITKLSEILDFLRSVRRAKRKALGTVSNRIEASGPTTPGDETVHDVSGKFNLDFYNWS